MGFSLPESQAALEAVDLSASRPPTAYEQGQELGFNLGPIPPMVVRNFRRYQEIQELITAGNLPADQREAFYVAYDRQFDAESVTETSEPSPMDGVIDATHFIGGYKDGLGAAVGNMPREIRERFFTRTGLILAPRLLFTPETVEAYTEGYSFKRSTFTGTDRDAVRVVNAHAFGFLVAAANLGLEVETSGIPTSEDEWTAFESGMDRENGDKRVSELFSEAIEAHQDLARLQKAFVLAKKISSKIPA